MFDGMAKPMPEPPATIAVLMPMTSPCMFTRGPPELPGLIAASVWTKSSNGPWPIWRALALMIPAVTVAWRPNGDPTARTQSPTWARSESPSFAARNVDLPSSSRSTARSVFLSTPRIFALCLPPSSVITSMSVARSTTWALVRAIPFGSTMTPEPRLRCGMRSGSSPKKRRKNSSPKNSSNGVRPWMPAPRDTVLMLMMAGLIISATAAQRRPQRLALQRLHTLELPRRRHEGRLLGRQDPAHAVVGPVEDRAHLRVDRPRGLLAVVALATDPHALEEERGALAERRQPHAFGHAVLRDHQARDLRRTLEVVVRARRDLAVDQLLGHAAAEEHRDAVLELAPRQEEAILGRQLVGHPERRDTPRDDRHLVHRVGVRDRRGHERVPHLVVGDDVALLLRQDPTLFLEPCHHTIDRFFEIGRRDGVFLLARREQGRLVDDVRQVGAREAGRPRGDHAQFDVRRQHDGAGVQSQDRLAATDVRLVHDHLAVEAAGAQQRQIEDLGAVRRGHEDHAFR